MFSSVEEENKIITRKDIVEKGIYNYTQRELFVWFEENAIDFEKEDEILLEVAYSLFKNNAESEKILRYLGKFFTGPTDEMKIIWRKIKDKWDCSKIIAEKIITQMLFSGYMVCESEIFY